MKYYRLIAQDGYPSLKKDVIYPEWYKINNFFPVKDSAATWPKDWQEVLPCEYWMQDGKLPKKWCIKPETEEQAKIIAKWYNYFISSGGHYGGYIDSVYHYPSYNKYRYSSTKIEHGHEPITFEEFEKYVLEKEEGFDTKVLDKRINEIKYENSMRKDLINIFKDKEYYMKKIIGYRCPMDLYNGKIKKGTVVECACLDDYTILIRHDGNSYYIPGEIVEKWEPVYEENIKIKGYNVNIYGDEVNIGCESFVLSNIAWLSRVLEKHDIKMEYRDEIKQIAEYYKNRKK